MKRVLFVLAMMALASTAQAQQSQPPADPALNACQQLLTGANNNLIQMAAQATVLSRQLEDAKAEVAKLKPPEK